MDSDMLYAQWREVGAHLRENSPDIYEMIFDKFVPLDLHDDSIVLGAESDYVAQWFLDAYGADYIMVAIEAAFGRKLAIHMEYGYTPTEEDLVRIGFKQAFPSVKSEPAKKPVAAEKPIQIPVVVPTAPVSHLKRKTAENCLKENTFENFMVGPENCYAFAAAEKTSQTLCTYNPLYIYGGSGMGKTHLIQAIANEVFNRDNTKVIRYVSCEDFLNSYLTAIRTHEDFKFRETYRNVDILLVDDVHFLGGNKKALQEEFFNTFNALYNARKQIIFTSDRPPTEIEGLEERLVSRFQSGVTLQITESTYETRLAILKHLHSKMKTAIPDEVLEFLASHITSNIRPLKNALTRLSLFVTTGMKVTIETAKMSLADILDKSANETIEQVSAEHVQKVVAEYFRLKVSELTGKKRTQNIASPRMIAMYLCRKYTNLSQQEIGDVFGGRTHATVIHALKQVDEMLKSDETIKKDVENLSTRFTTR